MNILIEACEPRRLMSHTLTVSQRAAINQLGTELVNFHTDHKIPETVVKAVYNDLLQCIKSAHTPSTSVSKTVIAAATKAAKDGIFTSKERSTLAAGVTSVLYSAGISKALSQASGTDVNTLFHEPKIGNADVESIFGTLVAIGESFK